RTRGVAELLVPVGYLTGHDGVVDEVSRLVRTPGVRVGTEVALVDETERAERAIRERVLESARRDADGNQIRNGSIGPPSQRRCWLILLGRFGGPSGVRRRHAGTIGWPLIGQE